MDADSEEQDPNAFGAGQSEDLVLMKRAWRNERAAPEILSYEEDLVARLMEIIDNQEGIVGEDFGDPKKELQTHIYTIDLNRARFLVRAYLRARLQKIERHMLKILSHQDLYRRLSKAELDHLDRYMATVQRHMEACVLSQMPDKYDSWLKQDETSKGPDMIPEPPLDSFVFCRVKEDIGRFALDERGDDTVDLNKDDLYVLRYRPVRELLSNSSIELV